MVLTDKINLFKNELSRAYKNKSLRDRLHQQYKETKEKLHRIFITLKFDPLFFGEVTFQGKKKLPLEYPDTITVLKRSEYKIGISFSFLFSFIPITQL